MDTSKSGKDQITQALVELVVGLIERLGQRETWVLVVTLIATVLQSPNAQNESRRSAQRPALTR